MSMRQLKISNSITNRESESLEKYLQEIGKLELITPEEEVRLALSIKQGDLNATNKLIKCNLRFVVSVAKQYQNQGLSLPDLINEGNIGLIKAAKCFDETKGFKFISYAVWWIRQSIIQAVAEKARLVRLPINKVSLTNKIQKTFNLLQQNFEREPSSEEIAEAMNMETDIVTFSLNSRIRHISMDSPITDGEENTLLDVMPNPNAENVDNNLNYIQSLNKEIDRALNILSLRQKQIICLYFGIGIDYPLSLDEIGKKLSITRERVRQIKDKALIELRSPKISNLLRSYLCKYEN